ncbi:hypothetical protein ACFRDV_40435 [Streptomyces fagopyri]|uniref:hypothetical protein n=1 Tax=Streptomyces fagopyri TaxID=2662397 RepID=UPI003695B2BD
MTPDAGVMVALPPAAVAVTVTRGAGFEAAVFFWSLPEEPIPTPMNRMTRAAGMTIRFRAHFGPLAGCGGIGGGGGTWPQAGPDGGG